MSPLPLVAITNDAPDDHLEPLIGHARIIKGSTGLKLMAREEILRLAPELVGIINQAELRVDAELLDAAPKLKIVANVAIGSDNLDKELMAARGVWATNVPAAFTEATADFTFALILALARRIIPADAYVRSGNWINDGFQPGLWDGMLLAGKTLGIVGYGRIGKAVARRARGFDMRVIFTGRTPASSGDYRPLETLLREADIVSLHVPLNSGTSGLLSAERLHKMKRGALLVNMSRGKVVDEASLVEALEAGHLSGAGLDVFENEPRVHPALLQMPQVVLTPHHGGGSHESRRVARRLCAHNIALVLTGEQPLSAINAPIFRQYV